jgi:hypothetical protein
MVSSGDFGGRKIWWKIVFFREMFESVIQNTATPLRIDFVSVANIHLIPCLAEGLTVAF